MTTMNGPQVPCRLETVRDWFLRQDSRQRGFSSLACRKLPPIVGRSCSAVGGVGDWSRATRWPRCHSEPLGIVGLVANFQGMPQILALEPWRAS